MEKPSSGSLVGSTQPDVPKQLLSPAANPCRAESNPLSDEPPRRFKPRRHRGGFGLQRSSRFPVRSRCDCPLNKDAHCPTPSPGLKPLTVDLTSGGEPDKQQKRLPSRRQRRFASRRTATGDKHSTLNVVARKETDVQRTSTAPHPDPSSPDMQDEIQRFTLLYSPLDVQVEEPDASSSDLSQPSLIITLTLKPTDPDFDVKTLCPQGLSLRVTYSYRNCNGCTSPVQEHHFCRFSIVNGDYFLLSTVSCTDPLIPPMVQATISNAFQYGIAHPRDPATPVYDALLFVDQCLNTAFEKSRELEPAAYETYVQQFQPPPWTQDEQRRLEEALIWYQRVADPKLKWKRIAELVSAGGPRRSPKECAARYLHCRDAVLSQQTTPLDAEHSRQSQCDLAPSSQTSPPDEGISSPCAPSPDGNTQTPTEPCSPRLRPSLNDDAFSLKHLIRLGGLELKNVQLLYLAVLKLQHICLKCRTSSVVTMKFPRITPPEGPSSPQHLDTGPLQERVPNLGLCFGTASKVTSQTLCSKCRTTLTLTAITLPVSQGFNCVARYVCSPSSCIGDILPPDLITECATCSATLLSQRVLTGVKRICTCSKCYATSEFSYISITAGDPTSSVPSAALPRRPRVPRNVSGKSITVGTPLPYNGTCKHYRKSFRWFRFPCCGQAFPCDVCHDESTDHAHERAGRMLCGHCSREQPCSDKPCACGGSIRGERTNHWEGGKGCRNPLLMNRKDNKKYKILHKKQQQLEIQRRTKRNEAATKNS